MSTIFSTGFRTMYDYAGKDACVAYLDGLNAMNPGLGDRIAQAVYGEVMADPILSYATKASINMTAMMARKDSSGPAANFHAAAMKKHGRDVNSAFDLGLMLQGGVETDINIKNAHWNLGRKSFLMAKVAALAGMDRTHERDLFESIRNSFNTIGAAKTLYAVNLAAVTSGYDAVEKASALYARVAQDPSKSYFGR